MKKFLGVCFIVFVFLGLIFLQLNFFSWFSIKGIKPNLFIIFSIIIGLFLGKEYGIYFGIFIGLVLDFMFSNIIGISAITLGVVGGIAGKLRNNFSNEQKFTILLFTIILCITGEILNFFLILVVNKSQPQIMEFCKILLIEIAYNIFFVIIMYPLIIKTGKVLEALFIEKKKQIQYF